MKIFVLAFITLPLVSLSQSAKTPMAEKIYVGNPLQSTYLTNVTTRPVQLFENLNIKGSPYLSQEFKPGYVQLKNGYKQNNVPVRFNIFTNELEFTLNGVERVIDSVDMVMYNEVQGDSSTVRLFKTGYPGIQTNKEQTIYEVIAMGDKAHLIKHTVQKIEERRVMGLPNEKVLVPYSKLYLFDVEKNTLEKVGNAKQQLAHIFPNSSSFMESIISEKNLSLKKEKDLGELVTDLHSKTKTQKKPF